MLIISILSSIHSSFIKWLSYETCHSEDVGIFSQNLRVKVTSSVFNNQLWSRCTSEARDFILVPHMGDKRPRTWVIRHCLPRHLSRKLDWRHGAARTGMRHLDVECKYPKQRPPHHNIYPLTGLVLSTSQEGLKITLIVGIKKSKLHNT